MLRTVGGGCKPFTEAAAAEAVQASFFLVSLGGGGELLDESLWPNTEPENLEINFTVNGSGTASYTNFSLHSYKENRTQKSGQKEDKAVLNSRYLLPGSINIYIEWSVPSPSFKGHGHYTRIL